MVDETKMGLKAGVAGAQLPPESASAGDWIAFADAQTGRLDQANGRTADAIAIVERCEAREREALSGRRLAGGLDLPADLPDRATHPT
jgi:hypothetical protein